MKAKNKSLKSNVRITDILCLSNSCPIQFVLGILGSKWSVLILRELLSGDRRTHELLEALPGISSKTLALRLRELEKYGLLDRQVLSRSASPCRIFSDRERSKGAASNNSS